MAIADEPFVVDLEGADQVFRDRLQTALVALVRACKRKGLDDTQILVVAAENTIEPLVVIGHAAGLDQERFVTGLAGVAVRVAAGRHRRPGVLP